MADTRTTGPPTDATAEAADKLEGVLTDAALADRVEMVVRPLGDDRYRAAAVDGWCEFRRDARDGRPTYQVTATGGRDPLADTSTARFIGHAEEVRARHPSRTDNSYPHAHDSIAQFFDGAHAPDLVALHTAAHHTDGHLGQHGSLGVVQARAPFVAAGAGVRELGFVDAAARVVDVAPTLAALMDVEAHPRGLGPTGERREDALLARQDGDPIDAVLDGSVADHVVVVLMDGCNANLLHDVIDAGEAPHLASLVQRGVSLRHGAVASLPTATLANHTTAVTGAHPGHSGVLHNTWVDRDGDATPDLLAMDQMFWAATHLADDVETIFEAVRRTRPDAFCSATFEFCDRGADMSSFALVRERRGGRLPELDDLRHADPSALSSEAFSFMSRVDHLSLEHTLECWAGVHGNPLPTLSWLGLAVTDEAGHESGPHGELARAAVRDSDARIGEVLAAVDRAGATDRTAVVVIADHGMEQTDPAVDLDWAEDVAPHAPPHREVGGGLFYLT